MSFKTNLSPLQSEVSRHWVALLYPRQLRFLEFTKCSVKAKLGLFGNFITRAQHFKTFNKKFSSAQKDTICLIILSFLLESSAHVLAPTESRNHNLYTLTSYCLIMLIGDQRGYLDTTVIYLMIIIIVMGVSRMLCIAMAVPVLVTSQNYLDSVYYM